MKSELGVYKKQLDASIADYCKTLLSQTELQYGPYSREAVETFCSLLGRGGKRLRGALTIASYQMAGGKDMAMIADAGRIIEMLNASLLIFDDIADLSDKRRGGPTVHRMFEDYHREAHLHGNDEHFGVAMGLHAGLLGTYLVNTEILQLNVYDHIKLAASNHMNRAIITTIHGQFNDIINEAVRLVGETQVNRTLTWKTAYYTLLQPLQLGLLLAGSKDADGEVIRDYAMHLGLAFQITDDILGTFGDEEKSGKSSQDDLKEGKITLLISRALARAMPEQKKTLLAALGNNKLTSADHAACKQIIQDTGALEYAQSVAADHARIAVAALDSAPAAWDTSQVAFLRDLAAYITARTQ